MKVKFYRKALIFYSNNFNIKIHRSIGNGLNIKINYRKFNKSEIWNCYRIVIMEKLISNKFSKERDKKFSNKKSIIKTRPKLRLFELSYYQEERRYKRRSSRVITKSYIRIDICLPGHIKKAQRA